jgi:putative DNA primase/helicase
MLENSNLKILQVKPENIPSPLREIPRWIRWTAGKYKDGGRYDKIPINKYGYAANAHDPKNWNVFEEALDQIKGTEKIGLALDLNGEPLADDVFNGLYLIGGDLDVCVENYSEDTPPTLNTKAKEILELLNTYYEVSPSGTGIRFYFACAEAPKNRNENGAEIYHSGRFLTMTGHGSGAIQIITQDKLDVLMSLMFPKKDEGMFHSTKKIIGGSVPF